ncbi:MAG: bifunctional 4-hydroxy-2-oxoglutarate aldolase/2-dehydro-3-deoxy-phosphogluconate aldolase [Oscillospiraceae bacterium]|nr:bifunctional 4-hydroxy-2-oxoglutarate aldolase/2-dehydro-3-deoxy-phosphogluconate aldolase [Oscillospiraceae bacterium]
MNPFVKEFLESKVIVVCRGIAQEEIVKVATALYEGGIRFMEVPFNQADPSTFAATAAKIKAVKETLEGKMHVGAGTVITMEQFELAKAAGAEIIVSPTMEEDVITATKAAGLISMPGCATPSEMTRAYKLGADLIKLFPSSMVDLKVVKEIRVPLNHLPLVCFGGVSAENIQEVLATGVVGVGVASAVLDKQALASKDYEKITALAKELTGKFA